MAFALADLKKTPGKSNMGGLLQKAYGVPLSHVNFDAALVLSATGKLDFAGPLVLEAGKKFIEMYSSPSKNALEDNSIGEMDGMSKENSYDFFFPGSEKEIAEFEAYALNENWIIIALDTTGKKRVLGLMAPDFMNSTEITADLHANLTEAKGSSGRARGDLKGKTFKFVHNAPHAPLYYTGAVDVEEEEEV